MTCTYRSWTVVAALLLFTRVAGAQTVVVAPPTVIVGTQFTATISNGPGNPADWVELKLSGAPTNPLGEWKYLNGSQTAPANGVINATITFTAPTTPGVYNVKFFLNNGLTLLTMSDPINVVQPGALAKFGTSGLVNSAIYEVNGHIGIGTTTPTAKLDVVDTVNTAPALRAIGFNNGTSPGLYSQLQVVNQDTGALSTTGIALQHFNSAGVARTAGSVEATLSNATAGSENGFLLFAVNRAGTNTEAMRVMADGSVGIGTSSPSAKLHVNGDVRVDGNIAAKYQDVAEWVESAEPLEAATLVVVDDTAVNRVTSTQQPYDSRVVGAVSAQPGIVLGEPGAGKVLVAQSGRVRVKADASYGAIRAGDLLVSSPSKGAVMRSQPVDVGGVKIHRPGTVVGKALEPLVRGTGEILVLLTLQ